MGTFAQFPVGPCPPTGPGEREGLGGWGRTTVVIRICGLAKEGARHHGYQAGLSPAAGHCRRNRRRAVARLREGRANTARGGCGKRWGGCATAGPGECFYTHSVVAVCRKLDVRFSIAIRQHKSLHNLIEAIPEDAWTPVPYWMDGAADVAEITYTPFQSEPDAAPVRLIVRRVKPTPGSQLALFQRLHHRPGRGDPGTGGRPPPPRRRECHPRPEVRRRTQPSPLGPLRRQRRLAGGQVMAHNLARWTARIGLGVHQDPPAAVLLPRRTNSARRLTLHLPKNAVASRGDCEPFHSRPDGATRQAN